MINNVKKIIVVGGNAAGPAAAAKAKRTNPEAEVLLFEAGDFISTGTCELPYVLAGEIESYRNIVFFDDHSFKEKKGVDVFLNHLVTSINPKEKFIEVLNNKTGEKKLFDYDSLILTTGSKAKRLPFLSPDLKNLFTLKSVMDFVKIKSYIDSNKIENVLIIGAGYIGLEAAEAFRRLGKNVTVLDIAENPLPNAEVEIQNLIKQTLLKNNVRFIGQAYEARYIQGEDKLKGVNIEGELIESDIALMALGVSPNNVLAKEAQLELGRFGGIKIDRKARTSDRFIFAAGDNTEIPNRITGKYDYMPLATYAHVYGHIAGANAAGDNLFVEPVVRNAAVKIFDNVYSTVGLTEAEAKHYTFNYSVVSAVMNNIIKVMPGSKKIFGKLIFEKESNKILGASFYGADQAAGMADLISALIYQNARADSLANINFNYTPPKAPFINLLSTLGRKAKGN